MYLVFCCKWIPGLAVTKRCINMSLWTHFYDEIRMRLSTSPGCLILLLCTYFMYYMYWLTLICVSVLCCSSLSLIFHFFYNCICVCVCCFRCLMYTMIVIIQARKTKNLAGVRLPLKGQGCTRCWGGVYPSPAAVGSGEGAVLPPQKKLKFPL